MKLGLWLGLQYRRRGVGVQFPDTIVDPIERAIVIAYGLSEATYLATGVSSVIHAWWRAGEGITLTSGRISQWNDKSGNAQHVIQGTAANRPIEGTLNGHPTIHFEGTRWLEESATAAQFILDHNCALYVVFRGLNAEASQGVIQEGRIGAQEGHRIVIVCDTRNTIFAHTLYIPAGVSAVTLNFAGEQSANIDRLFTYHRTGTTISGYAEGTLIDSDVTTTLYGGNVKFTIGRQVIGSLNLTGHVYEIIVAKATTSTLARQTVEAALTTKFL